MGTARSVVADRVLLTQGLGAVPRRVSAWHSSTRGEQFGRNVTSRNEGDSMRAAGAPDACSALRGLLRASHVGGPDELPAMVAAAGEHLGANLSVLYLVDYDQQSLEPLIAPGDPRPAESMDIDATLAGRAFTGVAQQLAEAGDVRT